MSDLEQRLRDHGLHLDRQAPLVGLAELERRIAEDTTPTDHVVGLEPMRSRPFSWRRAALLSFLATALLVLVGLGLLFLLDSAGKQPPADTPPTSIEPAPGTDAADFAVAEAFIAAWVAGDGEAVANMFSADGTFEGWMVGPDQIPSLHDWFRAVGWTFRDGGCQSAAESGRVDCAYTMEDDLLRALGREPATGTLVLEVGDGEIQSLTDQLDLDAYVDTWELFIDWVKRTYSDDFQRMYYPDEFNPLLDPTSIGLWERHTDDEALALFAADALRSREAQQALTESSLATAEAFMAAWVAGDGDAAARLFNPDGTYGSGATLPEELEALHDWYRAVGWEFQDLGCRAEVVATPNGEVVVACDFIGENDLGRALGWALIRDGFRIVIDGAGIALASERFGFDAYRDLWFTFKDWVAANHPDDLERMFLYPTQSWSGVRTFTMDPPFEALHAYPLVNETSIALWEQYVDEFVSSPEAVAQAMVKLEVARYVAHAVETCKAADAELQAEVAGLMQSETENFQQFFVRFPDLQSAADWHEAQAHHADAVIAQLRALPVPEDVSDSLDRLFALMEEETDLNRQVAAAAAAGDQARVDTLVEQRVEATHRKDLLAFSIGYSMYACPVSSAGA